MKARLFIACLACACGVPPRLEVPQDVTHVALATYAGDRIDAVTPLVPLDGALTVVTLDDAETVVVGYAAEQLTPFGAITPEPLQEATTCVGQLPSPRWSSRWADDDLAPTDRGIALSAAWAADACEGLDAVTAEVRCEDPTAWYRPVEMRSGGCDLDVTFESVVDGACGEVSRTIHSDDRLTVCAEGFDDGCEVVFHAPEAPWATVERISLEAYAARFTPPSLANGASSSITPRHVNDGRVHTMVAAGDRLLLSVTHPERDTERCGIEPELDGRLLALDRSTRAIVETATVPPCFDHAIVDEARQELVATFVEGGWRWVGRFGFDGARHAARRFDLRGGAARPYEMVERDGALELYLSNTRDEPDATLQMRLDPVTFATIETSTLTSARLTTVVVTEEERFGVLLADQSVVAFDRSGAPKWALETACDRPFNVHDVVPLAGDRVLVLGQARTPVVDLESESSFVRRTAHEGAYGFTSGHRLDDVTQLLLGVTGDDFVPEAIAARYRTDLRGVERGALTLGHGVAKAPFFDGDGRVWVLLPWDPAVVVITLAR